MARTQGGIAAQSSRRLRDLLRALKATKPNHRMEGDANAWRLPRFGLIFENQDLGM
jgi:hypothetical protein